MGVGRSVIVSLVCMATSIGVARAEPRELVLMDGSVIGAIAVDPPPEWPAAEGKDAFLALVESDGLRMRHTLDHSGAARAAAGTLMRLGRPVASVPQPPRRAFRSTRFALFGSGYLGVGELSCATTELLGPAEDDRWPVRVYRTGPSGERYVLQGWADAPPTPDPHCLARTFAFDTGTLPAYWRHVDAAARFPTGTIYWRHSDSCDAWQLTGKALVRRVVTHEDGCPLVTETRASVERVEQGRALRVGTFATTQKSRCSSRGMSMGSDHVTIFRVVAAERGVWPWIDHASHLSPAPVVYHPDDVTLWTRTRATCEATLPSRPPPLPVGQRTVGFCGRRLHPATRLVSDCDAQVDLTPLGVLPGLQEIVLYDHPEIVDLSPLRGLEHVTSLRLPNSQVSDLSPLAGFTRLDWLDVSGSKVSDLRPLHGLERLRILDIQRAPVDDAEVEALQAARPDLSIRR